jgi:hypothetical protein
MAFNLSGNAHVVTTWSALAGCVVALWWAFGFAGQVEQNTQGLKSAQIRDIAQSIRYLETEASKMEIYEQRNGVTVLSTQLRKGFGTDIKKLERERDCLKAGNDAKLCDED